MGERTLTAAVKSEVDKILVRPALFVEILLDGGPIRLWSGIGNFILGGNVYNGVGHFGGIDRVQETAGDVRATGVAMTLSGIPSNLISDALTEHFQGRSTTIWLAFFDANDVLIADEIKVFSGKADYPVIEEGGDTAKITVFAESRLVDMERPRIRRYTDEDQKELFPGDRGLEFVAGLQNKEIVWGG